MGIIRALKTLIEKNLKSSLLIVLSFATSLSICGLMLSTAYFKILQSFISMVNSLLSVRCYPPLFKRRNTAFSILCDFSMAFATSRRVLSKAFGPFMDDWSTKHSHSFIASLSNLSVLLASPDLEDLAVLNMALFRLFYGDDFYFSSSNDSEPAGAPTLLSYLISSSNFKLTICYFRHMSFSSTFVWSF